MSSPGTNDCVLETPVGGRLRKRGHESITNLRSQKRRRMSMASVDFGREWDLNAGEGSSSYIGSTADRFIPNRPKHFVPLNITPRTKRFSKQFGLIDDRVLNFRDEIDTAHPVDNTMTLLRRSASSLFRTAPILRPTSVIENLNKHKHCLLVLDSPGVPLDPEGSPISWSQNNCIAVACKKDIYYQNLDTKAVSHLCGTDQPGRLHAIQWGEESSSNLLAFGMSSGNAEFWDSGYNGSQKALVHRYSTGSGQSGVGIKSIAWNKDLVALGIEDGRISLFDVRAPSNVVDSDRHKSRVLSLKWSTDKNYLASGDSDGIVHIWDKRAGKSLLDLGDGISRIRHKGSVKAMAWCPWKPDLLATGSTAPEGKIRIWSSMSISAHSPAPIQTIPLNNSIFSLHWSPHCKELLSTHGLSFQPPAIPRRHSSLSGGDASSRRVSQKLTFTNTPLTNSIVVHEWPSGKRLMTLTNAHSSWVTDSCLGPTGESIFTVCPKEEAIKSWKVWSQRPMVTKRESAFDKYTIR
ncbi:hypothetical protein M413DRAFT_445069 [Hebeloma cylindrosporum]|uniref:CDC20/Fizzy WD40 domain-containing protein n=1 Tax=Hebeloma cylindrosporum TaxID=76867 RepID=A0A0C2XW18_HEBCY|nr:hypothetical protein M413DRAFT_445069 [Hebeloma cylindrosporum h7]